MSKNNKTGKTSTILKFYINENDDCELLDNNDSDFEDTILNNENDGLESNTENIISTRNIENKDTQNAEKEKEKEKEYSIDENDNSK